MFRAWILSYFDLRKQSSGLDLQGRLSTIQRYLAEWENAVDWNKLAFLQGKFYSKLVIFQFTRFQTSQIVNELLCEVMETQPITLSDWTSKLHQSFMLKWLCNKAEEVDEEQNQEWEK